MKILAALVRLFRGGVPVSQADAATSHDVQNFRTDYTDHKREFISRFLSDGASYGQRHDHIYKGTFFGKDGLNSHIVYLHENFTLVRENNRVFIVSTTGVYDPANYKLDLENIAKFPTGERDINGFVTVVKEIEDPTATTKEGKAIVYSRKKLKTGLPDLIGIGGLHNEVIEQVIQAAQTNRSVYDVCSWLKTVRLKQQ